LENALDKSDQFRTLKQIIGSHDGKPCGMLEIKRPENPSMPLTIGFSGHWKTQNLGNPNHFAKPRIFFGL